jgi:hypothetical protein
MTLCYPAATVFASIDINIYSGAKYSLTHMQSRCHAVLMHGNDIPSALRILTKNSVVFSSIEK